MENCGRRSDDPITNSYADKEYLGEHNGESRKIGRTTAPYLREWGTRRRKATWRRRIEEECEISGVSHVYVLRNAAQKAQLLRFPVAVRI